MVVRKKIPQATKIHGKMDLSQELIRVREAIAELPEEERNLKLEGEEVKPETGDATAPADPENPKTKEKPMSKKKVAKKAVKKSAKKVNGAADNGVKLAEVCKDLKMKPAAARRVLRGANVKNPGRWTFPKGSADLARVKKVLSDHLKAAE